MPFENFHSARLIEPGRFEEGSFRNITLTDGITSIVGRLKGQTTTTQQAVRFAKDKFSVAQARAWLADHDIKPILFEPAGKSEAKAFCPGCGSTAEMKQGADETYECAKCGSDMEPFTAKIVDLPDINIFRTGKWKGFTWTIEHLDKIIENFKAGIMRAYLKVTDDSTHKDTGRPLLESLAFGWVKSLRREGEKLFASFKQVPEQIAKLITGGALTQRSIEVWPDFHTSDGEARGPCLECILMFGTGLPAVHDLDEISEMFSAIESDDEKQEVEPDKMKAVRDGNTNTPPLGGLTETSRKEKAKMEEVKDLQAQIAKLEAEKSLQKLQSEKDANEAVTKAEGERDAAVKERDEAVAAATETKKAEAEKFVATLVKDGKLEPFRKEAVVDEIIARDSEKAKAYQDRLDQQPSLFKKETAANTKPGDEGEAGKDDVTKTSENRDKAIKAAMKADPKLSYTEANERLFAASVPGRI